MTVDAGTPWHAGRAISAGFSLWLPWRALATASAIAAKAPCPSGAADAWHGAVSACAAIAAITAIAAIPTIDAGSKERAVPQATRGAAASVSALAARTTRSARFQSS